MQGSRGGVEPKNGNNAGEINKNLNSFKMPRTKEREDDNERLDTIGGDDDYDGKFFDNDHDNDKEDDNEEEQNENKEEKEEFLIEVDLEKIRDDEELDIEKRFNVKLIFLYKKWFFREILAIDR